MFAIKEGCRAAPYFKGWPAAGDGNSVGVNNLGTLMPRLRHALVAAATRRYPFLSGCASLANSSLMGKIVGRDAGSVWCKVPGGDVLASLDDFVGRSAFLFGDLDRKVTALVRAWVRPGDIAVDIGANIGIVTQGMAKLVGTSGRVHAFEPNPVLTDRIAAASERNGHRCVTLHRHALGDKERLMRLSVPRNNFGQGSLVWEGVVGFRDDYDVPVRRLDEVLPLDTRIRFVKIDVEGFEASVLEGARALVERNAPDAILFEIFDRPDLTPSADPAIQLLSQYGYHFYSIDRTLMRLTLRPFDPAEPGKLPCHDLLAVHAHSRELPQVVLRAKRRRNAQSARPRL